MKQIQHIIALLSLLIAASCSDTYNIDNKSFSTEAQQSLAMATNKNMLKRSLDEVAVREINLWNKTILAVYPSLMFANNSTDFSLSTETTMHEVIKIINNHNNISRINVTSFNNGGKQSQQAQTIAAIIWDYADVNAVAISHDNKSKQVSHDSSHVNRIEITLE
jgi:hypothetical protein